MMRLFKTKRYFILTYSCMIEGTHVYSFLQFGHTTKNGKYVSKKEIKKLIEANSVDIKLVTIINIQEVSRKDFDTYHGF